MVPCGCMCACACVLEVAIPIIGLTTRHTHSINASCSYEVHEVIICIHTNGSSEDVALL